LKILFTGKNYSQSLKELDSTSIQGVAKLMGFSLVNSLSQSPDLLICVDYVKGVAAMVRQASKQGVPSVLVVNEPNVVLPQHGKPRFLEMFDLVIKVGRSCNSPVFKWPQTIKPLDSNPHRLDRAIVINADKWSFIKGQQYWLRAAVATSRNDVDVYGHGWDRSNAIRLAHRLHDFLRTLGAFHMPSFKGLRFALAKPKNYLGVSSDKVSAMSKYKVAIVIENSDELLTEKLIDAWLAGCIPVFVGPHVSNFGLDKQLVVHCDPNIDSVAKAIDRAMGMDHAIFLEQLKDYIDSKAGLSGWESEMALGQILRHAASLTSETTGEKSTDPCH
jgi:hypothetical protein